MHPPDTSEPTDASACTQSAATDTTAMLCCIHTVCELELYNLFHQYYSASRHWQLQQRKCPLTVQPAAADTLIAQSVQSTQSWHTWRALWATKRTMSRLSFKPRVFSPGSVITRPAAVTTSVPSSGACTTAWTTAWATAWITARTTAVQAKPGPWCCYMAQCRAGLVLKTEEGVFFSSFQLSFN